MLISGIKDLFGGGPDGGVVEYGQAVVPVFGAPKINGLDAGILSEFNSFGQLLGVERFILFSKRNVGNILAVWWPWLSL